jgi:hypothetical protein
MASRLFAGASRHMHRRHAGAKPLQSMDFTKSPQIKRQGARHRLLWLIKPGFQNGVFRTAKPRPAVGGFARPAAAGFDEGSDVL